MFGGLSQSSNIIFMNAFEKSQPVRVVENGLEGAGAAAGRPAGRLRQEPVAWTRVVSVEIVRIVWVQGMFWRGAAQ